METATNIVEVKKGLTLYPICIYDEEISSITISISGVEQTKEVSGDFFVIFDYESTEMLDNSDKTTGIAYDKVGNPLYQLVLIEDDYEWIKIGNEVEQ